MKLFCELVCNVPTRTLTKTFKPKVCKIYKANMYTEQELWNAIVVKSDLDHDLDHKGTRLKTNFSQIGTEHSLELIWRHVCCGI